MIKMRDLLKESQNSNTIHITVKDGKYTDNWYITKIDATHIEIVNNPEAVGKGGMSVGSILQYKNEPFYDDVKSWLRGGKSPDGKVY